MPALARAASSALQGQQGDTTVSSKQLASITNLNDCSRLLHETIAKERAIEAELDKQLSKRNDLERNILLLNATTSEVGSLYCSCWCGGCAAASAVPLLAIVTCDCASRYVTKVRVYSALLCRSAAAYSRSFAEASQRQESCKLSVGVQFMLEASSTVTRNQQSRSFHGHLLRNPHTSPLI